MKKFEGLRVWIGLAATVIGMTGLANYITPVQFQTLADLLLQVAGILVAVYGNIKAHQEINKLGGYR